VVCCHTSSADVCTLLALSEGLGRGGVGSLAVHQQVQDLCGDIDQEAAWGLDNHFSQDSPSGFVCLGIPGLGTSGVFDVDQHRVGFLDQVVSDPLAQGVSVGHSDLFWSPDTFSGLGASLDQGLAVSLHVERPYVLKDPALTGQGAVVLAPGPDVVGHYLWTGHIELSLPDRSVDHECPACLVFFGHIQEEAAPCSDLVPSVSGLVSSEVLLLAVSLLAPGYLAELAPFPSVAVSDTPH